jgi:hypothetical protein
LNSVIDFRKASTRQLLELSSGYSFLTPGAQNYTFIAEESTEVLFTFKSQYMKLN